MQQGLSGSGFENRDLIDSFEEAIKLRYFGGLELMLSIPGQEFVQSHLSGRRQETA